MIHCLLDWYSKFYIQIVKADRIKITNYILRSNSFRNIQEAQCAISRIHQMELLGFRLSAELSNKTELSNEEPLGKCETIEMKQEKYFNIIKKLNLNSLPPSDLKYKYPPPTLQVLFNIMSELYENKKFYTQVLHLMNKMNLQCPFKLNYIMNNKMQKILNKFFYNSMLLNQTIDEIQIEQLDDKLNEKTNIESKDEPMEIISNQSDTEEEIETEMENSDTENNKTLIDDVIIKSILMKKSKRKINKPKFIKPNIKLENQDKTIKKNKENKIDVFETPSSSIQIKKHIKVKVTPNLSSITEKSTNEIEEVSSEDISIMLPKTIPINPNLEENETEMSIDISNIISKEKLDSNRLNERDRSFVKAFNNYDSGTPSCRLYVKNLSKLVTQNDLEFIFKRYYLPDFNEQGIMFDIRLMQEGRMKGQAFITLQTIDQATQALEETNGFILKDKPMVVQYARSAQAKPN